MENIAIFCMGFCFGLFLKQSVDVFITWTQLEKQRKKLEELCAKYESIINGTEKK